MDLPIDSIRIGPLSFTVKVVDRLRASDGRALYGEISFDKCEIRIDEDFAAGQRFPAILWHEIIHGLLDRAGLGDTDEKVIEVLGLGIVELLQENPDLLNIEYGAQTRANS